MAFSRPLVYRFTGYLKDGVLLHDGKTCPIHEEGGKS